MQCKRNRVHQNLNQEYIRRIGQLFPDGGYIREKRENKGSSIADPHTHIGSLIVHEQVVKREAPHRKEDGEHRDEWIFVHGYNKMSILIVPYFLVILVVVQLLLQVLGRFVQFILNG